MTLPKEFTQNNQNSGKICIRPNVERGREEEREGQREREGVESEGGEGWEMRGR